MYKLDNTNAMIASIDEAAHKHDRLMVELMENAKFTKNDFVVDMSNFLYRKSGIKRFTDCEKKAKWLFAYYYKRGGIVEV